MTTITVPKEYGYVLLTATSSMFLAFWHGIRVGGFRRAAKIPYPAVYATPEQISAATTAEHKKAMYLFNCAQRAHANYLENYSGYLGAMLIAGLEYPKVAAATGVAWQIFRFMYARGYTRADRDDGKGRLAGSGFWFAQLVLFLMVGKMGVDMVMSI